MAEWAKQFTARGSALLQNPPRSGWPLPITGSERAARSALACAQLAKPPYAYSKPGSCCVLAAVEPRPG